VPWNAEYRLPARDGAEHTHWSLGVSTDEHAWQLLLAGRQRTWTAPGPNPF
jgi:hypothetical protein